MSNAHPDDSWNKGDPYELYIGRWSSLVARQFLAWLNPQPALRWLDVGCGTGALTLRAVRMPPHCHLRRYGDE